MNNMIVYKGIIAQKGAFGCRHVDVLPSHSSCCIEKLSSFIIIIIIFWRGVGGGGGDKRSWIFVGFCEKVLKFCLASLNLEMFLNSIFSWKTLESLCTSWKSPWTFNVAGWKQFFVDFGIPFPCLAILHTVREFYEEKLRKKVIHFKSPSIADFPAVDRQFHVSLASSGNNARTFYACLYSDKGKNCREGEN